MSDQHNHLGISPAQKPTSALSADTVEVLEDINRGGIHSAVRLVLAAREILRASGGTTPESHEAPAQAAEAIPPNETLYRRLPIGSDVERGDLVYQAIHLRPQKRQPDDVPRAGEDYSLEARIKRAEKCLFDALDHLDGTPVAALPTNAEAQAPVSAEAIQWMRNLKAIAGNSAGADHADEILRTLGATPAQP